MSHIQDNTMTKEISDLEVSLNRYKDMFKPGSSLNRVVFIGHNSEYAVLSLDETQELIDHLTELKEFIVETTRERSASEIIEAMEPGTKFTLTIPGNSDVGVWFRTSEGAVSRVGITIDNDNLEWFNDWTDPKIAEVN